MGTLIFDTIYIFSIEALFLIALLQAQLQDQWAKVGNLDKFFFLLGIIMGNVSIIIFCHMKKKIRKTKIESMQDAETVHSASTNAIICIILIAFSITYTFPFLYAIWLL